MRVITPVLDSGASPNLIHLRCVAEPWRAAIKSARSPLLIDASNRSMKAIGELKLHVRIGEFYARVPFLVVTNLAVDCILGTTFLDRHVKAILPPQRKGAVPSCAVRGADGSHTLEARPQNGLEGTVAAAPAGGEFGRPEARAVPDERTVTENSRCQGGHDTPDDPMRWYASQHRWGGFASCKTTPKRRIRIYA